MGQGIDMSVILADPQTVLDRNPLQDLHNYWMNKRRGNGFPLRNDIDPAEIPRLLPNLMLIDVISKGGAESTVPGFYFRLVGTEVSVGLDPTGKNLNEITPGGIFSSHLEELYMRAVDAGGPVFSRTLYHYADSKPHDCRRLFLPLAHSGDMADPVKKLLVGVLIETVGPREWTAWEREPSAIVEVLFTPL